MTKANLTLHTAPTTIEQHRPTATTIAAWLLAYESPRTRAAYGRAWAAWDAWCAGHGLDPWEPARGHVDAWAREQAAAGYAPATVALRLTAVSSAYTYALHDGLVDRNPVAHVRRPKLADDSPTLGLDRQQARAVLGAAAQGHSRDLALVCLLLLNGLRVSEATGATVPDLETVRGHRVLNVHGKGGKRRRAPLAPRTIAAIERHVGGREAGSLLVAYGGGSLTRSGAARVVRRVVTAAGITERISPHSLRHTAATLALEAGAPLHVVQDLLGHADPRTTRRYDRARHALDGSAAYTLATWLET